jgi:hypothetical protein
MKASRKLLPILIGSIFMAASAQADDKRPESASSGATEAKASAGGVSRDLEKEFRALDKNGDGFLSQDELSGNARLAGGFAAADKNGDGKLDMAEFQALEANTSADRSLGSAPANEQAGGGSSKAQ